MQSYVSRFLQSESRDMQVELQQLTLEGSPYKDDTTLKMLMGKLRDYFRVNSESSGNRCLSDQSDSSANDEEGSRGSELDTSSSLDGSGDVEEIACGDPETEEILKKRLEAD
jgi:hypothetical protein